MIDMDTRVRAARGIGKTETQAAQEAFAMLKGRGHPHAPPPTVSDGRGGIPQAMIEVWGQVPAYLGRGRPPTRKRAQEGWVYLKIVKRRKNRAVVRIHKQVVYGDPDAVLDLFGASTAYVERTHLTSRQFNGRLVRKTLGFSKDLDMHRASAIWEDAIYNLIRPLKTLRVRVQEDASRRWLPRTPAMASGLTDHIWTIRELLTLLPVPPLNNS
jgi:hypothetical protein